MAAAEIVRLPYRALRAALDDGSLGCVAVADAYLARIERYASLHAFAHVDAPGARAAAHRLDEELARGEHRGPLHGIPFSIKDGYPIAGLPCTVGSRALYDIVPRETCEIVAKAQAAGAVLLGINTMAEAGMGDPVREGVGANGRNPRNDAFVPGGSSTGTATATAAGLTMLGIGGDGGGSVRNPAATCGVVGIKPSDDRMPAGGSVPWAWSMGTSGFFGRDVATVEAALTSIVGTGPAAATAAPRILALPEDAHGELSDATRTAYRAAIELLGAEVGPPLDLAVGDAWLHRLKELAPVHALHLIGRGELYSNSIKGLVAALNAVTREQYLASFAVEERLAADLVAALAGYDALLTPANPWPGLRWDEWPGPRVFDWYRFAWPFNLVRFPGVTLPTRFGEDGMPLAVQLVGRSGEDERLLGVAAWAESLIELDRSPVSPTWA
jgi:aspartyl-tRNA(Asn)/glutamyl-tRNA(Gln) amidotransferase subunit A